MAILGEKVSKIRSKNAGPFWITVDVFCGSREVFDEVRERLSNATVSQLTSVDASLIKRFEIESLSVLKFSFPRIEVQGSRFDRDMHGAQIATLFSELEL